MMPSAKIVKRDSAPPENMLNMPRIPPCCDLNSSASSVGSMPGTGMCAPMRYTTSAPSRNSRRFFRSPYLPDLPIWLVLQLATAPAFLRAVCGVTPAASSTIGDAAAGGFDRGLRALGARPAPLTSVTLRVSLPARMTLARSASERGTTPADFSTSQIDRFAAAERFRGPTGAPRRRNSRVERHEAALGQAALQRHLAAFEADLVEAAGTRLLALVAATGGLAQAATDAAADAALRVLGAAAGLSR